VITMSNQVFLKKENTENNIVIELDSNLKPPKSSLPQLKNQKDHFEIFLAKGEEVIKHSIHKNVVDVLHPFKEINLSHHPEPIPPIFSTFLMAVHFAFQSHYPLILTPDTIWVTIMQSISRYINLHAEKLKTKFVDFDGKQKIKIHRPDFEVAAEVNPWDEVVDEISLRMKEKLPKTVHNTIICNFSTTNRESLIASEILLMATFQEYFQYEVYSECGIPQILLEGTEDDWILLKKKITTFRSYIELDWWFDILESILDQFIHSSRGHPNKHFWKNIYKMKSESGGDKIHGWIIAFYLYDQKDEYLTGLDTYDPLHYCFKQYQSEPWIVPSPLEFPRSTNQVPIIWKLGKYEEQELMFMRVSIL